MSARYAFCQYLRQVKPAQAVLTLVMAFIWHDADLRVWRPRRHPCKNLLKRPHCCRNMLKLWSVGSITGNRLPNHSLYLRESKRGGGALSALLLQDLSAFVVTRRV